MMDTKDKARLLRRAIILCWVLLAICLVVKIFGGNYFNIVCENENFIKFCNFVDNSFLRYVIYFSFFMFESLMLFGITNGDISFKSKNTIIFTALCIIFWVFKLLVEIQIIKISISIMSIISMLFLLSILIISSKKILWSLISVVYDTIIVILFTFIKNVSFSEYMTQSFLIDSIFMIDLYIALALTFLYVKNRKLKKEAK